MGYLIVLLSALTLTAVVFAPTMAMLVLIPPVFKWVRRSPQTRNRISAAIGLLSFGVMLALLMGLAWVLVEVTISVSIPLDVSKRPDRLSEYKQVASVAQREMWLRAVLPFPGSCNTTQSECMQAQRVITEFGYPDPRESGIVRTVFWSMLAVSLIAATMSIFFARLYTRPPTPLKPTKQEVRPVERVVRLKL